MQNVCLFFYTPNGCLKGPSCTFEHVHTCPFKTNCSTNTCWWSHADEKDLKPCDFESCTRKTYNNRKYCKPCYVKLLTSLVDVPKPKQFAKKKCDVITCTNTTALKFCKTCYESQKQSRRRNHQTKTFTNNTRNHSDRTGFKPKQQRVPTSEDFPELGSSKKISTQNHSVPLVPLVPYRKTNTQKVGEEQERPHCVYEGPIVSPDLTHPLFYQQFDSISLDHV